MTTKKIYFASDFHLGAPNHLESRKREDKIIRWLNTVSKDASDIYLVGDVFDFWFEYKYTIPKGYVRFLGKLAELIDPSLIFKEQSETAAKPPKYLDRFSICRIFCS